MSTALCSYMQYYLPPGLSVYSTLFIHAVLFASLGSVCTVLCSYMQCYLPAWAQCVLHSVHTCSVICQPGLSVYCTLFIHAVLFASLGSVCTVLCSYMQCYLPAWAQCVQYSVHTCSVICQLGLSVYCTQFIHAVLFASLGSVCTVLCSYMQCYLPAWAQCVQYSVHTCSVICQLGLSVYIASNLSEGIHMAHSGILHNNMISKFEDVLLLL